MTPAWDDLDAFIDLDDFAVQAVITASGVTRPPIGVIFDDPGLTATLGVYDADTSKPRMTGKAADLAGIKRRDTVVINGETFGILTSPIVDGTGLAVVELARE